MHHARTQTHALSFTHSHTQVHISLTLIKQKKDKNVKHFFKPQDPQFFFPPLSPDSHPLNSYFENKNDNTYVFNKIKNK